MSQCLLLSDIRDRFRQYFLPPLSRFQKKQAKTASSLSRYYLSSNLLSPPSLTSAFGSTFHFPCPISINSIVVPWKKVLIQSIPIIGICKEYPFSALEAHYITTFKLLHPSSSPTNRPRHSLCPQENRHLHILSPLVVHLCTKNQRFNQSQSPTKSVSIARNHQNRHKWRFENILHMKHPSMQSLPAQTVISLSQFLNQS